MRANAKACEFFSSQAPWYQRLMIHKVISPKQTATRRRWLDRLIPQVLSRPAGYLSHAVTAGKILPPLIRTP